jgi:multidrug efflux pump subunit AcrA (membrane-fusion protein)
MSRMIRKPLRSVLLKTVSVPLLLTFTSCSRSGGETPQIATTLPTVAVVRAVRADLSSDLVLTAEFEPFQEVDVMAKVSGYIRQIKVDIGDRVNQGQLLATLEIPEMQDDLTTAAAAILEATAELATAQEELHRAQSAHDIAHLSYSRILDVSKREVGLVPQQEVDEAQSRDLVAEAQVSTAKSRIATCEQRIRVSQAEEGRYKTL